jgi:large subunit ribosomal protein L25
MKELAILKIDIRTGANRGANKLLLSNGYILGNIYGKDIDSVSVAVNKIEFRKSLNKFGRNSVFKLESEGGQSYTVMVKEIQTTPILNDYHHVDFQQVSLSQAVNADVPIDIIGSELIETKRLLINRQLDIIPVFGLPQNVPDVIKIDVSTLNAGESFKISDIAFPEGITTEMNPSHVILSVHESKVQEEVETETETEEA